MIFQVSPPPRQIAKQAEVDQEIPTEVTPEKETQETAAGTSDWGETQRCCVCAGMGAGKPKHTQSCIWRSTWRAKMIAVGASE